TSDNRQRQDNKTTTLAGELTFGRSSRVKKGRQFNFFGSYNFNTGGQDQFYNVVNQFYRPNEYITSEDQLRDNEVATTSINTSFSYTEPFSKTLSAVVRYNAEYFRDKNQVRTFDLDPESETYSLLVNNLSDEVERAGLRNY